MIYLVICTGHKAFARIFPRIYYLIGPKKLVKGGHEGGFGQKIVHAVTHKSLREAELFREDIASIYSSYSIEILSMEENKFFLACLKDE